MDEDITVENVYEPEDSEFPHDIFARERVLYDALNPDNKIAADVSFGKRVFEGYDLQWCDILTNNPIL